MGGRVEVSLTFPVVSRKGEREMGVRVKGETFEG